ncbi:MULTISPECIES: hypothetical protein [unclassified Pantoea]|uniref:hypothetical protein n=1 Tax=Pantoea TaxID=53335 RepID=UPI001231F3E7|nr:MULTISPECIES: hypothetical protein [unclassified Pantoea]KAA6093790.1 hypothetical protein F3I21_22755 [Pantoea sp. B_9]KAA6106152.1 hypothetical protein F3I18_23950 [Pantoea sp. B_10]
MNIDAEQITKIRRRRAKLAASGELPRPRLLSEGINFAEAVEKLKQTKTEPDADVSPRKKRAVII